jgi:transporter family-2 protein
VGDRARSRSRRSQFLVIRRIDPRAAGVLAAFAGGVGGAAQSRVNGALAGSLHSGIAAALVSNTTALVLVVGALAVAPAARAGLRRAAGRLRSGTLRARECVGGACGALYVAGQGISAAPLGLAVFTVAVVAGQTGGGLAVDRAGIAPGGRRPVTRTRLLAAAVTVAAVAVAAGGRLRAGTSLLLAVLPLLAGLALAVQGAVNGRVQRATGAVLPAVFINAVVGTAALLLAFGVAVAFRGRPDGTLPTSPWLYLGGLIGVAFTAIGVAVVRRIGVLLLGLAVIAGQLTGALLLDLLVPGPAGPPGVPAFLGVVVTLVAVLLVVSRDRRPGLAWSSSSVSS